MNDITSNAVTKVAFIFMSMLLLAGACLANYRSHAVGLTLGLTAGLINARYLSMKVRQLGEIAAGQRRKWYGLGFGTRMCVALLVALIGTKLEQVSLIATLVGLVGMQIVTIIVSAIAEWKQEP